MQRAADRTRGILFQLCGKNPRLSGKIFLIQCLVALCLLPVSAICPPVTVRLLLSVFFQTFCLFQITLELSILFECLSQPFENRHLFSSSFFT